MRKFVGKNPHTFSNGAPKVKHDTIGFIILTRHTLLKHGILYTSPEEPRHGKLYIVYTHEWVQISNGTMEYMQLKDDLSETIGELVLMFRGNAGPWVLASKTEGCFVTDGPYLWKNKSGKLMMIWASYGEGGYTEGVAFSETGKLSGPWIQQSDPLYSNDGGHGMMFETFDGKLMMVLHSPNNRNARPHIFEMEDTGDALKIREN